MVIHNRTKINKNKKIHNNYIHISKSYKEESDWDDFVTNEKDDAMKRNRAIEKAIKQKDKRTKIIKKQNEKENEKEKEKENGHIHSFTFDSMKKCLVLISSLPDKVD